ncbi:MAG: hypothetical protein ACTHMG_16575 [Sphingomonas sp.]
MVLVGMGFAAASDAQTTQLLGPNGTFETTFHSLSYDPSTACTKPFRPYDDDAMSRQVYLDQAKQYLDCLQRTAERDTQYASAVIADGYKDSADDFLREVKSGY